MNELASNSDNRDMNEAQPIVKNLERFKFAWIISLSNAEPFKERNLSIRPRS